MDLSFPTRTTAGSGIRFSKPFIAGPISRRLGRHAVILASSRSKSISLHGVSLAKAMTMLRNGMPPRAFLLQKTALRLSQYSLCPRHPHTEKP
ncbi:hypothetical protein A2Z00_05580 [Candidatus Gottesmanbacteria bacterium RBG_13_45_10]|uniref:Uncharacterized protein n=1 Tax=Candidatus Gottesmanbacteria bacterium RBG_13_45_10 TaxID=1798370 RepID=A0A1F5ZFZ7_9BACT|nr:MAG: hypothetical protein A2Z00_05580 [Candidatus Gottesmanbacteria bacterium RBG_13_45_10]